MDRRTLNKMNAYFQPTVLLLADPRVSSLAFLSASVHIDLHLASGFYSVFVCISLQHPVKTFFFISVKLASVSAM